MNTNIPVGAQRLLTSTTQALINAKVDTATQTARCHEKSIIAEFAAASACFSAFVNVETTQERWLFGICVIIWIASMVSTFLISRRWRKIARMHREVKPEWIVHEAYRRAQSDMLAETKNEPQSEPKFGKRID